MGRLLVAIRLAAMVVWLLSCIPAYFLARPFSHRNPLPRIFLAGICRIVGVRVTTTGKPGGPRRIMLSNHLSWLDIPVLSATTGAAFVAHDGLTGSPLLKWLCDMNDTIYIARSRRSTVARQVMQVRNALDASSILTLFPEGTTGDGATLLPLKSALLSAIAPPPPGVSVQPVFLEYGGATRDIAWVGDEPGLDNFFKVLARRKGITATVHFLPPLAGDALSDRKAMAEATRGTLEHAMASMLQMCGKSA